MSDNLILVTPDDWLINRCGSIKYPDIRFALKGVPKNWNIGEVYDLTLPEINSELAAGPLRLHAKFLGYVFDNNSFVTEYHFAASAIDNWSPRIVTGPWESNPDESVTFSVPTGRLS